MLVIGQIPRQFLELDQAASVTDLVYASRIAAAETLLDVTFALSMAALLALTLKGLHSLTSVDVLSSCASLRMLELKEYSNVPMDKLVSLPDMSGLEGLEIKYDTCTDRLKKLLSAWDAGGRKALSS